MTTFVMTAIVLSANVLGAGMAFPQARKLVRTRRLAGLSQVWVGISVAMNSWWLSYGMFTGLWVLVPVSSVSLALYLTIAVVMFATAGRMILPRLVVGALGFGLLPVPALLLGGWALAGVTIGIGYGAQLAPAVVAVYRTDRLDGVASGTWLMALAESLLWLIFGVHAGDVALLVGGGAGVVMASLIVGRLAVTGHHPLRAAWSVG